MVGKSLQARNGEAGVSVSNINVGISVAVVLGCEGAGDAVHVAGSCNWVGYPSVGPSGCWPQDCTTWDAIERSISQILQVMTDKTPRVIF